LKVKPAKSHIGFQELTYLGYRVDGEGFTVASHHQDAIQRIPQPRTRAQLRTWNGMVNYFRTHIPQFAWVAKPLFQAAAGKGELQWTPQCQIAFDRVRELIAAQTKIHYIDYGQPLLLRTDASTVGAGGVLYQNGTDGPRYNAFMSVAFDATQQRWATIEQEMFAAYYCIIQCQSFLQGHHFILETDHRNLEWLAKATAPKLVRWRLRLQEFDYEVKHIKGSDNVIADTLSRLPADAAAAAVTNTGYTTDLQALLQEGQHEAVVRRIHNGVQGHFGARATVQRLLDLGLRWPHQRRTVDTVLRRCPECQRNKHGRATSTTSNHHIVTHEPYELACVDTIGPVPPDHLGNTYIIVVIDAFSRFVELVPTPAVTAVEAARALLHIFGRYGLPKAILSDRGTQFVNSLIREFLEKVGVGHATSVPYRHEGNGIVERANQETMRHLRTIIEHDNVRTRWSEYLPRVQFIMNQRVHSATGIAPVELIYGRAITAYRGLLAPFRATDTQPVHVYLQQLQASIKDITTISDQQQEQTRAQQDRTVRPDPTFPVGQLVLAAPGATRAKLDSRWLGPYRVEAARRRSYTLRHLATDQQRVVDVSMLREYVDNPDVTPAQVAARDKDTYIVESIRAHRGSIKKNYRRCRYLVHWEGYDEDQDTWEPYGNLHNNEVLMEYLRTHGVQR